MIKKAFDKGFVDTCKNYNIKNNKNIISLYKIATYTDNCVMPKEALSEQHKSMLIGGLGGAGIGAGIGGYLDGWRGAGIGGVAGAGLGTAAGWGYAQPRVKRQKIRESAKEREQQGRVIRRKVKEEENKRNLRKVHHEREIENKIQEKEDKKKFQEMFIENKKEIKETYRQNERRIRDFYKRVWGTSRGHRAVKAQFAIDLDEEKSRANSAIMMTSPSATVGGAVTGGIYNYDYNYDYS